MFSPIECIDFYKADHRRQYPGGTEAVYSNLTARSERLSPMVARQLGGATGGTVFFGLQHFIYDFLGRQFGEWFQANREVAVDLYRRTMDDGLGPGAIPVEHVRELHRLGHLPVCIRALPEGTFTPIGVPMLTIHNTHKDFAWLTNYLETVMSASLWKPITTATIAFWYRCELEWFAALTGTPRDFVRYQAHDFSFRGMSGVHDAALSGAGHLLSFYGTDTVPAIGLLRVHYEGEHRPGAPIGCSVPATEHSVMSMGGQDDEIGTFRRLITQLYPQGIVSIVSDTWDFWRVLSEYARDLRDEIVSRDGKVVFRPDSGDPVKIICGDPDAESDAAKKGAVRVLWDIFGGTVNAQGFKQLDPHVGLIYGDSITPEIMQKILGGLAAQGFASGNIVFGVGSYTYQYVTRDTFGMAMKATYGIVDGLGREIYKDPKTASGVPKKSHRGLLSVVADGDGVLRAYDRMEDAQWCDPEVPGLLADVYLNGHVLRTQTLADIRRRIDSHAESTLRRRGLR